MKDSYVQEADEPRRTEEIMPEQYLVILDNNLIDEPLAPGLPYWTFPVDALPTAQMAAQFVEDILYQSELWANDGEGGEWISLRLLECQRMCRQCGHIVVTAAGGNASTFHVVWYIVINPQPEVMGNEAYFGLGLWHDAYLSHCCSENYFEGQNESRPVRKRSS